MEATGLDLPFIVVSGTIGEETAVALMKAGAHDYLMKDKLARLAPAVKRELAEAQSRRERQRAEKRFQSLIEHAPDGIVLVTVDGKFKYISPSARRLFGYGPDEVITSGPLESTHPDDLPAVLTALNNLIQDPAQAPTLQYRFQHKAGSWRWIESTFSNLLAEPGVEAIVINFHDITERKQAERNLELLAQAGRELGMALNLRSIYTTLHRLVQRAMPCDFLFVSSFGAADQLIRCAYGSGPQGEFDVLAFPLIPLEAEGRGTQSLVIRSGEPLLLNDYAAYLQTANTTYYVTEDGQLATDNLEAVEDQPRSALIVPLKLDGQVVGVIQVQSLHPNAYAPRDLQFLESLALHVSTALANAQLLAQVQNELAERKRAEEALLASEARFRSYTESAPSGIFIVDRSGRYVEVNPAAAQMLGYTAAEFLRLSIPDLLAPQSLEAGLQLFQTLVQDGSSTGEMLFRRKDSTQFWASLDTVRLSEDRFMAYCQDITERKQAELLLRESEERYQTLARISPVGIFRTDPDGLTTYVNPAWCAISRLSVEEALGDSWLDAVHPDDKERLGTGWQASTQLQKASLSDYRFVHSDGTIAWVMGQAVPEVNIDGQIIGYVGTITDITALKQAETALQSKITTLRALAEIDREITAATEAKSVLELVCRRAAELVQAPKSAIVTWTTTAELELTASYGLRDAARVGAEFAQVHSKRA